MPQSNKRWKEAPENISDFFLGFFFPLFTGILCGSVHVCACVFEVGVRKNGWNAEDFILSANSQHTQDREKLQEGPKKTENQYKLRPILKSYIGPPYLIPAR